jgi:hypothetical protein
VKGGHVALEDGSERLRGWLQVPVQKCQHLPIQVQAYGSVASLGQLEQDPAAPTAQLEDGPSGLRGQTFPERKIFLVQGIVCVIEERVNKNLLDGCG